MTYAAASNTNKLELMQRPFALGNVPSSAAYAVLAVVKYNTRVVAPSDSYLFWGLPQLEVVAANTQGPSPYSSGPVGAIGSEQILAKSATDFGLSAGIYGTGQIGNSAFDITQVEATRTWTNSTSAPVDVHVIGSVANVSTSFNGSYSTVTQSYTQLDYSVSSGGSDSVIMVAKAPPGDGTALAVSGSGQLYATVPVGATITANITSREANTTSGSAIGGSYQLSLTAVIK